MASQSEPARSSQYLVLLWENWVFIAGMAAIAGFIGLIYSFYSPRIYEATVNILILPTAVRLEDERTEGTGISLGSMMAPLLPIETLQALARSPDILKDIIEDLGLEDIGVVGLRDRLSVSLVQMGRRTAQYGTTYSEMLILSARARDPEVAAKIVERWAEEFKERMDALMLEGTDKTGVLLEEMYATNKRELEAAEDNLRAFYEDWNLELLEKEKEATEELITTLEAELSHAEVSFAGMTGAVTALEDRISTIPPVHELLKAPSVDALSIAESVSGTTRDGAAVSTYKTEEYNPAYSVVVEDLSEYEGLLHEAKAKRQELRTRIAELRERAKRIQTDLKTQTIEEARLLRNIETVQTTYSVVAENRELAKLARVNRQSDLVIADKPIVPELALGLTRFHRIVFATMAGAVAATLYVLLRFQLDVARARAATTGE